MTIMYGNENTWADNCPFYIHVWKCRCHPEGVFNIYVPYPQAFENPQSTILPIPRMHENEEDSDTTWRWNFSFVDIPSDDAPSDNNEYIQDDVFDYYE